MSPLRVALLGMLLVAAPLAGCFGGEVEVNERKVTASGGKVSRGWAYDGAGVVDASATLSATFLDAQNAGEALVTFQHANSTWEVVFDEFAQAPGKDFMGGGVAFDLVEHGDSGVADASIPKILALVAAWGTASVTRDGEPVGDGRWSAHLMASDTTVRNAEGKILKADGAAPYDPTAPGDATRVEGDRQVFLKLVHPGGEMAARPPVDVSGAATFAGPEATQSIPVPAERGATDLVLTLEADGGANPVGAGQFTARVVDEAGAEVAAAQQGQVTPNGGASLQFAIPAASIMGPLSVEVTGTGAFTARVTGTILYDDPTVLVLTWDDPTIE